MNVLSLDDEHLLNVHIPVRHENAPTALPRASHIEGAQAHHRDVQAVPARTRSRRLSRGTSYVAKYTPLASKVARFTL